MNRLQDKIAVVTGANSGVGAAIAKLFAKEGATVVMTARREAALEEVASQIESDGGTTFVMATDISKLEDPERLMAAVEEKYDRIDILVNNAGILEKGLKPIDRFSDEDLDRIRTESEFFLHFKTAKARQLFSISNGFTMNLFGILNKCRAKPRCPARAYEEGCRNRLQRNFRHGTAWHAARIGLQRQQGYTVGLPRHGSRGIPAV